MILFEPHAQKQFIEDAISTFPDECCGFLFGHEKDDIRTITAIQVVDNSKAGDKTRRFEISPLDYMKGEQYALENNLTLLGVYHSHPNHPAIPSEHDRVAAQPYFSYLIISVLNGKFSMLRSWRLTEEDQFEEEKIADIQYI